MRNHQETPVPDRLTIIDKPSKMITSGYCLITRDGKILLVRRRLDAKHFPGKWGLPGGKINPEEDIDSGTEREVFEETRLEIRITKHQPLGQPHRVASRKHRGKMITLFLCQAESLKGKPQLSNEHIEFRWLTPVEALKLDLEPQIDFAINEFISGGKNGKIANEAL